MLLSIPTDKGEKEREKTNKFRLGSIKNWKNTWGREKKPLEIIFRCINNIKGDYVVCGCCCYLWFTNLPVFLFFLSFFVVVFFSVRLLLHFFFCYFHKQHLSLFDLFSSTFTQFFLSFSMVKEHFLSECRLVWTDKRSWRRRKSLRNSRTSSALRMKAWRRKKKSQTKRFCFISQWIKRNGKIFGKKISW